MRHFSSVGLGPHSAIVTTRAELRGGPYQTPMTRSLGAASVQRPQASLARRQGAQAYWLLVAYVLRNKLQTSWVALPARAKQ